MVAATDNKRQRHYGRSSKQQQDGGEEEAAVGSIAKPNYRKNIESAAADLSLPIPWVEAGLDICESTSSMYDKSVQSIKWTRSADQQRLLKQVPSALEPSPQQTPKNGSKNKKSNKNKNRVRKFLVKAFSPSSSSSSASSYSSASSSSRSMNKSKSSRGGGGGGKPPLPPSTPQKEQPTTATAADDSAAADAKLPIAALAKNKLISEGEDEDERESNNDVDERSLPLKQSHSAASTPSSKSSSKDSRGIAGSLSLRKSRSTNTAASGSACSEGDFLTVPIVESLSMSSRRKGGGSGGRPPLGLKHSRSGASSNGSSTRSDRAKGVSPLLALSKSVSTSSSLAAPSENPKSEGSSDDPPLVKSLTSGTNTPQSSLGRKDSKDSISRQASHQTNDSRVTTNDNDNDNQTPCASVVMSEYSTHVEQDGCVEVTSAVTNAYSEHEGIEITRSCTSSFAGDDMSEYSTHAEQDCCVKVTSAVTTTYSEQEGIENTRNCTPSLSGDDDSTHAEQDGCVKVTSAVTTTYSEHEGIEITRNCTPSLDDDDDEVRNETQEEDKDETRPEHRDDTAEDRQQLLRNVEITATNDRRSEEEVVVSSSSNNNKNNNNNNMDQQWDSGFTMGLSNLFRQYPYIMTGSEDTADIGESSSSIMFSPTEIEAVQNLFALTPPITDQLEQLEPPPTEDEIAQAIIETFEEEERSNQGSSAGKKIECVIANPVLPTSGQRIIITEYEDLDMSESFSGSSAGDHWDPSTAIKHRQSSENPSHLTEMRSFSKEKPKQRVQRILARTFSSSSENEKVPPILQSATTSELPSVSVAREESTSGEAFGKDTIEDSRMSGMSSSATNVSALKQLVVKNRPQTFSLASGNESQEVTLNSFTGVECTVKDIVLPEVGSTDANKTCEQEVWLAKAPNVSDSTPPTRKSSALKCDPIIMSGLGSILWSRSEGSVPNAIEKIKNPENQDDDREAAAPKVQPQEQTPMSRSSAYSKPRYSGRFLRLIVNPFSFGRSLDEDDDEEEETVEPGKVELSLEVPCDNEIYDEPEKSVGNSCSKDSQRRNELQESPEKIPAAYSNQTPSQATSANQISPDAVHSTEEKDLSNASSEPGDKAQLLTETFPEVKEGAEPPSEVLVDPTVHQVMRAPAVPRSEESKASAPISKLHQQEGYDESSFVHPPSVKRPDSTLSFMSTLGSLFGRHNSKAKSVDRVEGSRTPEGSDNDSNKEDSYPTHVSLSQSSRLTMQGRSSFFQHREPSSSTQSMKVETLNPNLAEEAAPTEDENEDKYGESTSMPPLNDQSGSSRWNQQGWNTLFQRRLPSPSMEEITPIYTKISKNKPSNQLLRHKSSCKSSDDSSSKQKSTSISSKCRRVEQKLDASKDSNDISMKESSKQRRARCSNTSESELKPDCSKDSKRILKKESSHSKDSVGRLEQKLGIPKDDSEEKQLAYPPNQGNSLSESCAESSMPESEEPSLRSTNYWASHSATTNSTWFSEDGTSAGLADDDEDDELANSTAQGRKHSSKSLDTNPTSSSDVGETKQNPFPVFESFSVISGLSKLGLHKDASGSLASATTTPSMQSSLVNTSCSSREQPSDEHRGLSKLELDNPRRSSSRVSRMNPGYPPRHRRNLEHTPCDGSSKQRLGSILQKTSLVSGNQSPQCLSPRSIKSVSFSLSPGLSNLGLSSESNNIGDSHMSRTTGDDTTLSSHASGEIIETTTSDQSMPTTMVERMFEPLESMVDEMFHPLNTTTSDSRVSRDKDNENQDEDNGNGPTNKGDNVATGCDDDDDKVDIPKVVNTGISTMSKNGEIPLSDSADNSLSPDEDFKFAFVWGPIKIQYVLKRKR